MDSQVYKRHCHRRTNWRSILSFVLAIEEAELRCEEHIGSWIYCLSCNALWRDPAHSGNVGKTIRNFNSNLSRTGQWSCDSNSSEWVFGKTETLQPSASCQHRIHLWFAGEGGEAESEILSHEAATCKRFDKDSASNPMERSTGTTLCQTYLTNFVALIVWNCIAALLQCQESHFGPTCSTWGGSYNYTCCT